MSVKLIVITLSKVQENVATQEVYMLWKGASLIEKHPEPGDDSRDTQLAHSDSWDELPTHHGSPAYPIRLPIYLSNRHPVELLL